MPHFCGLKNLTLVTLPPVWIHLHSACTPAPLTKRGSCILPRAHRGSSQQNVREPIWTPPSDLTVVHRCVELVNQLISLKIPTLVAACFMVCVCVVCGLEWVCHVTTSNCASEIQRAREYHEPLSYLFSVKLSLIAAFWFLLFWIFVYFSKRKETVHIGSLANLGRTFKRRNSIINSGTEWMPKKSPQWSKSSLAHYVGCHSNALLPLTP